MNSPWHGRKLMLVDLDDTLYRVPEVAILMRDNIQNYMTSRLGVASDVVSDLCLECYSTHGTTMAGLTAKGYKLEFDDWHSAVHASLPYHRLLAKDEALASLLQSISLPKYLFTNADQKHAETCLRILGLEHLFEGIICFESIQQEAARQELLSDAIPIICKPMKEAFELALDQCGGYASTSIFLDDSHRNVAAARALGMFTVHVGCSSTEAADLAVPSLHQLPAWLWAESPLQPALPALEACCQEEVMDRAGFRFWVQSW